MFRGLSNVFLSQAEFFIAESSQKDVVENFNIKKFPSIVGLITSYREYPLDVLELVEYDGKFTTKEVKAFIEKIASPTKRYENEIDGKITHQRNLTNIFDFIADEKQLSEFNVKYDGKIFILYLNDGKYLDYVAYNIAKQLEYIYII
jgi:hypothetical protein